MVENWERDLAKGRRGERIVLNALSAHYTNYTFEDVADKREYFKYGDIRAISNDGSFFMFEVKNDEVIATSRNVLCEELVAYKDTGEIKDGFMYNYYQYYCIVSEPERKIYILDFKVLKKLYKQGQYKEFPHKDQTTYGYLLPLKQIERNDGILTILEY